MKKYIPYAGVLLILTAFIVGRMSGPDNSKALYKKYEDERKSIFHALTQKQVEIVRLNKILEVIKRERVQDSIYFAGALEKNQRAYNILKKKYNEINLNRASIHDLDSVVSVLYP